MRQHRCDVDDNLHLVIAEEPLIAVVAAPARYPVLRRPGFGAFEEDVGAVDDADLVVSREASHVGREDVAATDDAHPNRVH